MTSLAYNWLFGAPKKPVVDVQIQENKEQTPEEALNALLEQFKSDALPASSRFYGDPALQREFKPPSVLELWRHAWFIASKSAFPFQSLRRHPNNILYSI